MSLNDSGVDEVIWACSSGVTNLGGVVAGVNIVICVIGKAQEGASDLGYDIESFNTSKENRSAPDRTFGFSK